MYACMTPVGTPVGSILPTSLRTTAIANYMIESLILDKVYYLSIIIETERLILISRRKFSTKL